MGEEEQRCNLKESHLKLAKQECIEVQQLTIMRAGMSWTWLDRTTTSTSFSTQVSMKGFALNRQTPFQMESGERSEGVPS